MSGAQEALQEIRVRLHRALGYHAHPAQQLALRRAVIEADKIASAALETMGRSVQVRAEHAERTPMEPGEAL